MYVSKQLNVGSRKKRHAIAQGLFLTSTVVGGRDLPFPLKFALKVTQQRNDFDQ